MNEVTVRAGGEGSLRPLIETAIANELRNLRAGISRTEKRLREFEMRHGMSTAEFVQRYQDDQFEESLDFVDWIGEYRLLTRLIEKADLLQGAQIAD